MIIDNGVLVEVTSDDIIEGRFTVPEDVTRIGLGAFRGRTSLTALTIPEGVTIIRPWAFRNCTSLTAVTIPGGVISIGRNAFHDCTSLEHIVVDGNASEANRIKGLLPRALRSKVVSKQRYILNQLEGTGIIV